MTEADWLASTDVTAMLTFVEGKVSPRKLRLFAVACCWRIWPLLTDTRSRKAIKVATRYADGEASERDRTDAYLAARCAADELGEVEWGDSFGPDTAPAFQAAIAARNAVSVFRSASDLTSVSRAAVRAKGQVRLRRSLARRQRPPEDWPAIAETERAAQAALLRDITGPLRSVVLEPDWKTEILQRIAEGIYETRDFVGLPILADALEDAGCLNTLLLDHCRAPGEHTRGCWAIDLVLDRS